MGECCQGSYGWEPCKVAWLGKVPLVCCWCSLAGSEQLGQLAGWERHFICATGGKKGVHGDYFSDIPRSLRKLHVPDK